MDLQAKRTLAKSFYLYAHFSQKKIAEMCGVQEKTLKAWIDKYRWGEEKEKNSITRQSLLKETYSQLTAINKEIKENYNGIPTKTLSDAKGVLIKEIEALDRQPLHKIIEVLQDVLVWCGKHHHEQVQELAELLNEFIESIATREGIR